MNAPDFLPLPGTPDERLDAWLDDALAPEHAAAVADRVAADPVWAEAAVAADALRTALAAPLPTAPPDFAARVFAALPAAPAPVRTLPADARPPVRRGRLVRTAAGLAAAIALLVVGVHKTSPVEPVPSAEEVAQARAELEWTLAYLNKVNAQAAAAVVDALPAPEPSTP